MTIDWNWIKENWTSPLVLVLIPTLFAVWVLPDMSLWCKFLFWIAMSGLTVSAWCIYNYRVPRIKTGRTGVIVAIDSENAEIDKRIRTDLIEKLQRQLGGRAVKGKTAQLVILPPHKSKRLARMDNESLAAFMKKSKSELLVFGTAKKREFDGGEKLIVEFDVLVQHCPISREDGNKYSMEIRRLLPKRLIFSEDGQFVVLEVTSTWMDLLVRYILAITLIFEGNVDYAVTEMESIHFALERIDSLVPNGEYFHSRVEEVLGELYAMQCNACYEDYIENPQEEKLDILDTLLVKAEGLNPDDYRLLLVRAAWHFLKNRDIEQAAKLITKCKSRSLGDGAWRYSDAFLTAYEGKLLTAIRKYRKAFSVATTPYMPLFVEQFIHMVINIEPKSYHLYFCLALINVYDKRDMVAAASDFKSFLARREESSYLEVLPVIQQFLTKGEMDIEEISETAVAHNDVES